MVAKKTKENTIEAHLNPTPIKLQIQKNQTQLKPTSHQHSISENHFSDPKQSRNPFCRLVMFGCCGRSWSLLPLSTTTTSDLPPDVVLVPALSLSPFLCSHWSIMTMTLGSTSLAVNCHHHRWWRCLELIMSLSLLASFTTRSVAAKSPQASSHLFHHHGL